MTPLSSNLNPRPAWPVGQVNDPAYSKLGSLVKRPEQLESGDFAFFGVPFEGLILNDIGGRGGPDGLRQALAKLRPYSAALDLDITHHRSIADLGDVVVNQMDYAETFEHTEEVMGTVLQRGLTPVVAGGSHSITEATLRSFSEFHGKNVGVVWFDAHPDLMDEYNGDRHYCGCPLRRLLDGGHLRPENVAFIGLRGFANSGAEIRYGKELGIRFFNMEEIADRGVLAVVDDAIEIAADGTDAFYTTFDTDVLDHTFAPGTQYPCPGGLQALESMRAVRQVALAGAGAFDVVEFAPLIDTDHRTGNLLANLMGEFMAGRVARDQSAVESGSPG